ncbi:MAG: PrsW family intramembrane metalloprotease, partial [Erysipelotrichaceae bacterium]|nr:PrsW family intramembrane metalloprotease [Erysipelotrichaceae bacterium]
MNSPTYQSGGFLTILAAVIPAVFLLYKVYQYDRTEKEPTSLIVSLVMLGVLSTFCAIATEQFGIGLLSNIFAQDSILFRFFMFFFVVGLSEEGFKFLFLKRRTWNDPNFDTTYDGIIYAVAVSLGFALFENIMYVGRFGLEVAAVRAVTAIPGHACFSVFMGVWYAE